MKSNHGITVKFIKTLAKEYCGRPLKDMDRVVDEKYPDVTFYPVGRNASHDFYLGFNAAGEFFWRAFGEGDEVLVGHLDDGTPVYDMEYRTSVHKIKDTDCFPYVGHF